MDIISENPAPPQAGSTTSTSAPQTENDTGYKNPWCLLLGIPEEMTEKEVFISLKAQGLQIPETFEWKEENQINYLKAYFQDPTKALDLILRDIKVGFSADNLVYPVMVLPFMVEMPMTEMLKFHEVQVDSSADIDTLTLYLSYITKGDILDIIEINPKKHIIIFTKQPKAYNVIQSSSFSLPQAQTGQEVILTHSAVDRCYPVTRKSINYSLEGLRLKMNSFSTSLPLNISANTQGYKEEAKKPPLIVPPTAQFQQQTQALHSLIIQTQQKPHETSQPRPPSNPKVFMTEKYEAKSKDKSSVGIKLLAYEMRQYDNQNRGYNEESIRR